MSKSFRRFGVVPLYIKTNTRDFTQCQNPKHYRKSPTMFLITGRNRSVYRRIDRRGRTLKKKKKNREKQQSLGFRKPRDDRVRACLVVRTHRAFIVPDKNETAGIQGVCGEDRCVLTDLAYQELWRLRAGAGD